MQIAELRGSVTVLLSLVGNRGISGPVSRENVTASDVKPLSGRVQATLARVSSGLPRDVVLNLKQRSWGWTQEGVDEAEIIKRLENGIASEMIERQVLAGIAD